MLLKGRTSTLYLENALMQLALAKSLGKDGEDLKKWTLDGLKAFATYAYDEQNNTFRPMLANGKQISFADTLPNFVRVEEADAFEEEDEDEEDEEEEDEEEEEEEEEA